MRRTKNSKKEYNPISVLQNEFSFFQNSPLKSLTKIISAELEFPLAAFNSKKINQEELISLAGEFDVIAKMLPRSFKHRFDFDSLMVEAIYDEWSQKQQRLSHPLIPHHEEEWKYKSVYIPITKKSSEGDTKTPTVSIVYFPSGDDISKIDLLDYPFLCHELGHSLFFFDDKFFVDDFTKKLNKFLGTLRLRAIADHGNSKKKADKVIEEIDKSWKPLPTHQNWAHELAIDIIALWTCGPAYLAAFQDKLEENRSDIFYISQTHPPYEIRLEALVNTGFKLGWETQSNELRNFLNSKRRERKRRSNNNLYVALTSEELVRSCVNSALKTCHHYNLPICDQRRIKFIERKIQNNQLLDYGTELIIGAWIFRSRHSEQKYISWEQNTINELLSDI